MVVEQTYWNAAFPMAVGALIVAVGGFVGSVLSAALAPIGFVLSLIVLAIAFLWGLRYVAEGIGIVVAAHVDERVARLEDGRSDDPRE